jgi:PAS domain S-box-containing protein
MDETRRSALRQTGAVRVDEPGAGRDSDANPEHNAEHAERDDRRVTRAGADALLGSRVVGVIEGEGDRIIGANDAFLAMLGYRRDDLLTGTLRWPELTPPEWSASDEAAYQQLTATGEHVPIEKEFLRRDGTRAPVLVHALTAENGRWVALVVELSGRRDANAALRLGERRYRSLAEATNAIVWTAGADGRFTAPQLAWEAYTGQPWEEHRGFGFTDMVHPRDRELATKEWAAAARSADRFERVSRVWHGATASYRTCVVRGFPVHDDAGVVTGWVGTVEDIHDEARALRADGLRAAIAEVLRDRAGGADRFQRLVRIPVPAFADLCYLYLAEAGRRVAIAHVDREMGRRLRALENDEPIDPDGPMPAARAARTGKTVFVPTIAAPARAAAASSARMEDVTRALAMTSAIAVPVHTAEGTVGAFLFAYTEASGRTYEPRDVELAEDIGERFSQLFENERLEAERLRALARIEVLARVGDLAATELDVGTRLRALPDLLLPALGDSCAVYVTEPDGHAVRLVAYENVVPELHDAIGDPASWPLFPIDGPSPGATAVRTGRPFLAAFRDPAVPRSYLAGAALERNEVAGPGSLLAVPMLTDDVPLGAIAFGYRRGGRRFTDADVPFAQEVARRVTSLLDQAQRFQRERGIAEMLQRSFLPPSLPALSRHDVAVRYLPGTAGLKVGGDWYDVVPLRDGRVVVAVGDVAGHGVEAAGTMGRVRTSLRVHAREATDAADLLDRVNQYVLEEERSEMVTLAVLIVDPVADVVECALAGHPPPLVRRAAGVDELPVPGGPPLGVRHSRYSVTRLPVVAGETLLLYTDGLVERRGESFDVGVGRLVQAFDSAPVDVEQCCDHVLHELLHDDAPSDDVAIVAVRVVHEPVRLSIPFEQDLGELYALRHLLRRWVTQYGADDATADDIVIVAAEAASNAIEHARSAPDVAFLVTAFIDDGAVDIEVRDFGRWRTPREDHDGRGLKMMQSIVPDVDVRRTDEGTSVRFRAALR